MALRLIRITGWLWAWIVIAGALILMATRRSITFHNAVWGDVPMAPNFSAELVALTVSGLMLAGVALIRPHFLSRLDAKAKMQKSEATYRTILDNMTDTYYRTDSEGRIVMASASAEKLLGYSHDELIGKQLAGFYLDANGREAFLKALKESGGDIAGYISRLRHKDGRPVLVETNAKFLLDEEGNVIGVEGVARDITENEHARELITRFGRIIEDSINEIYVFDSETLKFVLVNRGARENLGYTIEELREVTPVDIKPHFTAEQFADLVQPIRDGTRDQIEFETVHSRKDGSTYDVEVHLQLVRTENPPVFVAVIMETTERKAIEEQLRQSQKMESVGQLTGGVAHDFNNLLAVILGNIEIVAEKLGEDSPLIDSLDRAVAAADRGAELTQRLLAFSRKQALEPVVVDLNERVGGMVELLRRALGETIEIEVVKAGGLWRCFVDPGQLENVILNLAVNARDAMPVGGKLTVETANARLDDDYAAAQAGLKPGQYVMLAVSDTGSGMPPEEISHAFEPFFTTKPVGQGTGLGLSMVYGFAKQSGGHAAIYSEQDHGTTVKIYLPKTTRPSQTPARVKDLTEPQGHGEVVLVVEDDRDLRTLAVALLEGLGYRTLDAASPSAALEILEREPGIDLLFSDVVLPGGMNGPALAERALRLQPAIKVLFMSGYTENAIVHHGRLDEGVILLQKPFRKRDMARKVREALQGEAQKEEAPSQAEVPAT